MSGDSARTGCRGEDAAAEYLLCLGFELCDRNWRCGRYELDIVARRGRELHFVEVKTRKARGLTTPEQAMTAAKCHSMLRAASAYMARQSADCEPHFDLVAVAMQPDGTMDVQFVADAVESHW